ncbi:hypothetical protein RM844_13325 [Streptomyces sp. DSM 44915]|uniref:Secreted protein n=1 Tax=Streptomyces chisholmiae TaxID=3075540 RepID=A0ABU2JQK6_9ACTN|nr:hypothetical protein [Streptomyces sp. DSM 44915]MDT0267267.1 hypothetical protein [Streptomyces sp. DSM 44915]
MSWFLFIPAVLLFLGAVLYMMFRMPATMRRQREAQRRALAPRRARAHRAGWREVEETAESPEVVRKGARGGDVWLLAHRRARNVDMWVVCREAHTTGPGGSAVLHSLGLHLRPRHAAEGAPRVRLVVRNPLARQLLRGRDAFDRRYRIVTREPQARALVTEEVRAATLDLRLPGWTLRDGVLSLRFDGLCDPVDLDGRLADLARLAKRLTG